MYTLYNKMWIWENGPHRSVEISKNDALAFLNTGGWLLRNTYNFDNTKNREFYYVIKDTFGGLEELPTKVRNEVRKALKTYEFKRVDKTEMINQGLELFNKSRSRFGSVKLYVNRESWEKRLNIPNQDFWLGFDRESSKPASFAITKKYIDCCEYSTLGYNPDFPNNTYPMYGLIFEMNRYYLETLKLDYVLDGSRSITEHSNIQPFLEKKFKFRKAYCDMRIYYKFWFGLLVKLLFPFRKRIKHAKTASILRQEAWARGLEK